MLVSSKSLGFVVDSENPWVGFPESKVRRPTSLFDKTSLLIKTRKDLGQTWLLNPSLIPWKAWNPMG